MIKTKIVLAIVIILTVTASLVSINPVQGAFSPQLSSTAQTETTVTLSWTQSDDWFFSNYNVTYSTSPNGPFYQNKIITEKSQTSTYVDGLSPNTDYYFIVYDSASAVGTTPSNTLYQKTKMTPSIQMVTRTQSMVSLSWTDYNSYSTLVPFESYVIQMSTNGAGWTTLTTLNDYTQNTYSVTGLSPAAYAFRMYDKVGSSGQYQSSSNTIQVTINTPLQIQISPSTTSIYSNAHAEISTYVTGGTGVYNYYWYLNGELINGASSSSYTFYPVSSGTYTIYAKVQDASDQYLDSASSSTITLSVTNPPPDPTNNPPVNPGDGNQGDDGNDNLGTRGGTFESSFPTTYLIIIVVVLIVVVIAAVGILIKRKSGQKPLPPPP